MYSELYLMLEQITLAKTGIRNNRLDFPQHRRYTFGWVRERFSGKHTESLASRKYPDIYKKLIELGSRICPHIFTSVHVIKNLVCPPHTDKANIGISTIVSFGEYTGAKLIIEGEEQDVFERPYQFNGYEKRHWNTDDLVGTKYSVIFFSIPLPEPVFPFRVAIPSYNRSRICAEQTLQMLANAGVPNFLIDVFVVEDEYDKYMSHLDPEQYGRIICGKIGLSNQRNFISGYYSEGTKLVCLDDDIREVDLQYTEYRSLTEFIMAAFDACEESNVYLWSVNPVYNPFWREKKLALKKTSLNFCIGAFCGMRVRHLDELKISLCPGGKEDVEQSIRYYLKDGKTFVFNRVGFKTRYFGMGGLGGILGRIESAKMQTEILCAAYPELCSAKVRKNGMWEVKLKK